MRIKLLPVGEPVTLWDCRPGYFLWERHVGFKSEYHGQDGVVEAFNEAGERFWGGVETVRELNELKVQPLEIVKIDGAGPSCKGCGDAASHCTCWARQCEAQLTVSFERKVTCLKKQGHDGEHFVYFQNLRFSW